MSAESAAIRPHSTERVAGDVILADAQRVLERKQVVDPVEDAARGVDHRVVAAAVTAQVGGDGAEPGRQSQHHLLPEGVRGGVAVYEQHGRTVGRTAGEYMHGQARRGDAGRGDAGEGRDTWHVGTNLAPRGYLGQMTRPVSYTHLRAHE